ncbi:2-oxoacid:acceptor oxidoreductase subunit alpha [Candidatus Beckwithbacteria bacterium]|nr:2-oxoacid:acceptor oxidoreductase subunit alpha [Candidatus Beckwithbacteria bacterium]
MPISSLFTLKIGGEAGQGIKSAGLLFGKVATRSGYWIFNYTEYPSLVRGGHNMMQTTISSEEVTAPTLHTNLLIALNQETIDLHHHEISDGGAILFDKDKNFDTSKVKTTVNIIEVPLVALAKKVGGMELMSNTVALGASVALLAGDIKHLRNMVEEEFGKKKPAMVKINQDAAQAGFDYIVKNYSQDIQQVIKPRENPEPKMIVNANETTAMGAIAAGMQFYCAYPMTPATNIIHNLAPLQQKYGFIYKQPEDEIASINMAIGAANAGARSMVGTSGGGFCLMAEGYGLAGITETPLVIVNAMRSGPATGLPTWSEQSDLLMALYSHQGDFPRIVLAAGDPEEAFYLTMKAFNLAEKYQTTVLLLTDKLICENDQSYHFFDYKDFVLNRGKYTIKKQDNYNRYELTDDGISLRSPLGVGNFFIANSDEHDAEGFSNEGIENRNQQMAKRMKKMEICKKEDMDGPTLFGPEEAEITLVSWGSNKGSILQALKEFDNVNYLHLTMINPFPVEQVAERLKKAKYLINVEQNFTAHMSKIIKQTTGIEILDNLLKYDGRPIYPEEIISKINQVLGR